MEKAKSKDRPLIIIILISTSINLILTAIISAFIVVAILSSKQESDSNSTAIVPLPQELAAEEDRVRLFEEFQMNYNSGDNEKLLSMFGKAYQLELMEHDFDTKMKSLRNLASRVENGAYSRYEFEELGSGLTEFRLFYTFQSPEGLGELRISLKKQGDQPYEMFAINISTKK